MSLPPPFVYGGVKGLTAEDAEKGWGVLGFPPGSGRWFVSLGRKPRVKRQETKRRRKPALRGVGKIALGATGLAP